MVITTGWHPWLTAQEPLRGKEREELILTILSPGKRPAMNNQSFIALLHIVLTCLLTYYCENLYPYTAREIQILPAGASFELPRTGLCAVSHGCQPVVPRERMTEAPAGVTAKNFQLSTRDTIEPLCKNDHVLSSSAAAVVVLLCALA